MRLKTLYEISKITASMTVSYMALVFLNVLEQVVVEHYVPVWGGVFVALIPAGILAFVSIYTLLLFSVKKSVGELWR